MRWAPTPSGGPRRGPAAARRRGGRTAAQPARRPRTGKQSPGSGRDAPRVAPSAPIPVPTFARRRPGTLGGENMRKPEAPACGSPASLSPGRQGQRGARANPPPHYTRGCCEDPPDPSARGVPTSSSRPPHHRSPQRPAQSQASGELSPTSGSRRHRRCQAARLPGPAPPPAGPAPCGLPASGHRLPPSSARRLARVRHVTWVRRAEGAGKASAAAPRGGVPHPGGCWEALFERSGAWRHLEVVVLNYDASGQGPDARSRPCEGSWSRSRTEAAGKRSPRTPRCPTVFLQ